MLENSNINGCAERNCFIESQGEQGLRSPVASESHWAKGAASERKAQHWGWGVKGHIQQWVWKKIPSVQAEKWGGVALQMIFPTAIREEDLTCQGAACSHACSCACMPRGERLTILHTQVPWGSQRRRRVSWKKNFIKASWCYTLDGPPILWYRPPQGFIISEANHAEPLKPSPSPDPPPAMLSKDRQCAVDTVDHLTLFRGNSFGFSKQCCWVPLLHVITSANLLCFTEFLSRA